MLCQTWWVKRNWVWYQGTSKCAAKSGGMISAMILCQSHLYPWQTAKANFPVWSFDATVEPYLPKKHPPCCTKEIIKVQHPPSAGFESQLIHQKLACDWPPAICFHSMSWRLGLGARNLEDMNQNHNHDHDHKKWLQVMVTNDHNLITFIHHNHIEP